MSNLSRLRSLWRNLVHRRRVERELDDEVRGTLEMLAEEHRQAGMSPAEARRAATIQLGRIESLKEQDHGRQGRRVRRDGWIQDVRYAVRLLRRGPLFAVFAIGSLALGIGATGAIFSLFDGIALRRLNVPEPDRLVVASWGKPGARFNYSLPYPQFEAIRQRSTTLEAVCWRSPFGRVAVTVGGEPQAADGVLVSGDYYRTLRLAPALGRLLDRTDDRRGQTVAVLTSCLLAAPLRRADRRDRHDHRAEQSPVHDCRRRARRLLRNGSRTAVRCEHSRPGLPRAERRQAAVERGVYARGSMCWRG